MMLCDSKFAIMFFTTPKPESNFWHGAQNPTQIETAT